MKKSVMFFCGVVIGLVNVLLGTGAGIVAVMLLKKQGMGQKQAQANSLAVMLPTGIISLIIYSLDGYVKLNGNFHVIATAVAGAAAGTFILRKLPPERARQLLGAFMVFAGIRLMTK